MPNPMDYRVTVKWSGDEQDQCFVARVREFPSLATHGDTKEAAAEEMRNLLRFVFEDMAIRGERIPEPMKGD